MKKELYTDFDLYTPAATALVDEVDAVITPLMNRLYTEGYKIRDVKSFINDRVLVADIMTRFDAMFEEKRELIMDHHAILNSKLLSALSNLPLGVVLDERGNISSVRHEDGFARIYEYDANGYLITTISEDGYSSWFTRDEEGNKLSWGNSLGMKVRFVYGTNFW